MMDFHTTDEKRKFQYQHFRRSSHTDDYFGTTVPDPYRWLEDPNSAETKQFVAAQNRLSEPYIDSCTDKSDISLAVRDMWNFPKVSAPFRHGDYYFQYRNSGIQNHSILYKMKNLTDEPSVLLNPNSLSSDGTVAISGTAFSEDGATLAYGLSTSGSDWLEIKFRDVDRGIDYPEVLKKVKFSAMTWMHDNIGFFYGAYLDQAGTADGSETDANSNQKLYYHKLGTPQSQDVPVVHFPDPLLRIGAHVSHCGAYLLVTCSSGCKNNLVFYHKFSGEPIRKELTLTPVISEFYADFTYITNYGETFLFHTNASAPLYRVISIDLDTPDEEKWDSIVPMDRFCVLDWVYPINNNMLVLCYLEDVKSMLYLFEIDTLKLIYEFPLDIGTIATITGKRSHSEMYFTFVSFLTPGMIYKVEFNLNGVTNFSLFHEIKVRNFDASLYRTRMVFFKSTSSKFIPMFIVQEKNIDQSGLTPCILYGYGGFNLNMTPSFSMQRIIFLKHFRGMYAIACIRGGGEYGDNWHNAGRFENKQNCFDDFQFAAKYLLRNRFTSVKRMIVNGASNGGLLVAACLNQAPELFGAGIVQVGVLDMLRYHKFTIGYAWKSDYGCSDVAEEFEYLKYYSPLHNIVEPCYLTQYPATLLLTGDHDDRVVPLHSYKFIAELQHVYGSLIYQKNPLMIRIDTKSGHGAGKPTSKQIAEIIDIFCFVSKALTLPFFP